MNEYAFINILKNHKISNFTVPEEFIHNEIKTLNNITWCYMNR